jgi:hypothetical protein
MTRWQVRRDGAEYSTPAVDLFSAADRPRSPWPRGPVPSRPVFRASHIGSNGRPGAQRGDLLHHQQFEFKAVPFDLKALQSRRSGNPATVRTIPSMPWAGSWSSRATMGPALPIRRPTDCRTTGGWACVLGDYSSPSVLQLTARTPAISGSRFLERLTLRPLPGDGAGPDLPVVFEYQDGGSTAARLLAMTGMTTARPRALRAASAAGGAHPERPGSDALASSRTERAGGLRWACRWTEEGRAVRFPARGRVRAAGPGEFQPLRGDRHPAGSEVSDEPAPAARWPRWRYAPSCAERPVPMTGRAGASRTRWRMARDKHPESFPPGGLKSLARAGGAQSKCGPGT